MILLWCEAKEHQNKRVMQNRKLVVLNKVQLNYIFSLRY
jgi:hypothetical protein